MNTINKLNSARYTMALSAHVKGASAEQNAQATKDMHQAIRSLCIKHDHATGVYRGEAEPSFIAYPADMLEVLALLAMANKHEQECALLVDDSNALLVFADGTTSVIGKAWRQAALSETYDLDNYTYIDGHYFVIA